MNTIMLIWTLLAENPSINLYNPDGRFLQGRFPAACKILKKFKVNESLISNGCIIEKQALTRSILSYAVKVWPGASNKLIQS